MKVRLTVDEAARLASVLDRRGLRLGAPADQRDVYYKEAGFRDRVNGPGDFLIRLRYAPDRTTLNMKKLTHTDGVWEEMETDVADGAVVEHIIKTTGVEHAVTVRKARRKSRTDGIEVILDDVAELGPFLEVAIETSGDDINTAKRQLMEFLAGLDIDASRVELRGYPTILLEKEGVRFSVK
jgi:predicted adenylyl cyclase CyaB